MSESSFGCLTSRYQGRVDEFPRHSGCRLRRQSWQPLLLRILAWWRLCWVLKKCIYLGRWAQQILKYFNSPEFYSQECWSGSEYKNIYHEALCFLCLSWISLGKDGIYLVFSKIGKKRSIPYKFPEGYQPYPHHWEICCEFGRDLVFYFESFYMDIHGFFVFIAVPSMVSVSRILHPQQSCFTFPKKRASQPKSEFTVIIRSSPLFCCFTLS